MRSRKRSARPPTTSCSPAALNAVTPSPSCTLALRTLSVRTARARAARKIADANGCSETASAPAASDKTRSGFDAADRFERDDFRLAHEHGAARANDGDVARACVVKRSRIFEHDSMCERQRVHARVMKCDDAADAPRADRDRSGQNAADRLDRRRAIGEHDAADRACGERCSALDDGARKT